MTRSLTIRKPKLAEVRQLHRVLEDSHHRGQRRRAEAVLLYAAGLNPYDIADVLGAHVNTIYADLHAFNEHSVAGVKDLKSGGAAKRISDEQVAEIWRLAEQPPYELGLPYGRWSLSKFREYLIKRRVVKTISREHLRRLLKRGISAFGASSASSSVMIPADERF
jgi:transposase